jgi:hypothetical protein
MSVKPGDLVRCRDAFGEWFETTARSCVRIDQANAPDRRRTGWPTVSVDAPSFDAPVNWPAEDVEPVR